MTKEQQAQLKELLEAIYNENHFKITEIYPEWSNKIGDKIIYHLTIQGQTK